MLTVKNDNIKWCYHFPLYLFCVIIFVIIFRVLSPMLSFEVIIFHGQEMYHFYVIIFPCTYFVFSFMLSFDVIIYCYHFPPFFFFLKTWHTLRRVRFFSLGANNSTSKKVYSKFLSSVNSFRNPVTRWGLSCSDF